MNRIVLTAVAVLGLAGAAAAQDAPIFQGNFSASVRDANDRTVTTNRPVNMEGAASAVRTQQSEPQVGRSSTDANPWLSGR
jgi:hypothetical protein